MKLARSITENNNIRRTFPIILPILMAIFPPLFYYSNNLVYTSSSSLFIILFIFISVASLAYLIAFIVFKNDAVFAAISASIFMFFFNTYGFVFNIIQNFDKFRMEHYTFLPVILFFTYIIIRSFLLIPNNLYFKIWQILSLILSVLIIFNLFSIIPYEIRSASARKEKSSSAAVKQVELSNSFPDIYYLVFDEFSGFGPIKNYWGYEEIIEFENHLTENDFHIFHESQSLTINTIHEMATRFNYANDLPCNPYEPNCNVIANSNLYIFLKEKGYTFIEFNQTRATFPDIQHFNSDFIVENHLVSTTNFSKFLDEFGIMVLDQTMISAFPDLYKTTITDERLRNHKNMIDYTLINLGDFDGFAAPRFVYVHLLIPHNPFMFDQYGNILDQQYEFDWNYYLGNYIYSLTVIKEMVTNIQEKSDAINPPVIILQSDHGARNHIMGTNQNTIFKDFPEEYKFSILFAIHAPDCSFDEFPNDLSPVNTFPIVFNCIFNDNIPLVE